LEGGLLNPELLVLECQRALVKALKTLIPVLGKEKESRLVMVIV
jgi:hypothetical protein